MKLLDQSLRYLSISIFGILSIWALIFYFNMLDEIKKSVDEGLDNYKRQIITRAAEDSTLLSQTTFREGFFTIEEIQTTIALQTKDTYIDTIFNMQDADDEAPEPEPVRMLSTAFELDGKFYQLRVINSMVEEDDLVKELFWDTVWLYFSLVLGIIFIHQFLLRRLWKPFYELLTKLKEYRISSNQRPPVIETTSSEFKDL